MHRLLLCFVIAAGVYSQAPAGPMSTTLKVGDTAPDFTLPQRVGNPSPRRFPWQKDRGSCVLSGSLHGGCTAEMQKYQLGADNSNRRNASLRH